MAGGRGKIHEHPNHNTNGFDKNPQNIVAKGRPTSFLGKYKEIVNDENGILWVTTKWTGTEEQWLELSKLMGFNTRLKDGQHQIGMELNKKEKVIARLDKLILSKKDAVSLNAIKFIWEQVDGKPKQNITLETDLGAGSITIE